MDAKNNSEIVRIDLTPSQAQVVKEATGRDAAAIELTAVELEQRIAPRLAANSNETLLSD